jgi:hypothetical protein
MPNMNDLTTLTNLKAWLGNTSANPNTAQDALYSRLITSMSSNVLNALMRPTLISRLYTEDLLQWAGGSSAMLRQWPVTSILSLSIGSTLVTPNAPTLDGYSYETWDGFSPGNQIILNFPGYRCSPWPTDNMVTYQAGYLTSDVLVIGQGQTGGPTQSILQPTQSQGIWSYDNGVIGIPATSLTGLAVPFIRIPFAANVSPTSGTYMLQVTDSTGVRLDPAPNYLFSPADLGVSVTLNYSYVPFAVEQAIIEAIQDNLSYKSRIGVKSKNLGGQESVTYSDRLSFLPPAVASTLQQYNRVTMA